MEYTYRTNNLSIAPRKLRLVVDKVRSMPIEKAIGILPLIPNKGAQIVLKSLNSAVSSAVRDQGADQATLEIRRVWVDQGRPLKRMIMGSRGRSERYMKISSHLVLVLAPAAEGKKTKKSTK